MRRFVCEACGSEFHRAFGRCPNRDCGVWGKIKLGGVKRKEASARSSYRHPENDYDDEEPTPTLRATPITQVRDAEYERLETGIDGLDYVLGDSKAAGPALGSVILVSGDPGAGKTTLLLQAVASLSQADIDTLYITGEQSEGDVSRTATRIDCKSEKLSVLSVLDAGGDLEATAQAIEDSDAPVVVVDSIQTLRSKLVDGPMGGVNQLKAATVRLAQVAKQKDAQRALFLVCHVNKMGDVAGPKTIEHLVDVVLYLENLTDEDAGEDAPALRKLKIKSKNRFGPTTRVAHFRMTEEGGMEEVDEDDLKAMMSPKEKKYMRRFQPKQKKPPQRKNVKGKRR